MIGNGVKFGGKLSFAGGLAWLIVNYVPLISIEQMAFPIVPEEMVPYAVAAWAGVLGGALAALGFAPSKEPAASQAEAASGEHEGPPADLRPQGGGYRPVALKTVHSEPPHDGSSAVPPKDDAQWSGPLKTIEGGLGDDSSDPPVNPPNRAAKA